MPLPLKTKRLDLHNLVYEEETLRTIVGWLNHPDVVRFSEQRHRTHNIQSQVNYFNSIVHGNRYVGIYLGKLLIGTMTATFDKPNSIANIGIMLGEKSQWGHGYGQEAWSSFCDELFREGVRKIEAGCMSINYRMMGICQHYGMVEEGRQDKHFVFGEGFTDLVHWGKFNEPS